MRTGAEYIDFHCQYIAVGLVPGADCKTTGFRPSTLNPIGNVLWMNRCIVRLDSFYVLLIQFCCWFLMATICVAKDWLFKTQLDGAPSWYLPRHVVQCSTDRPNRLNMLMVFKPKLHYHLLKILCK